MEIYHKENGKWIYDIHRANDALSLSGLGIQFPLQEAYVDLELEQVLQEGEIDDE